MQGEKSGDFLSDFLKKYYSNLVWKIAIICCFFLRKKYKKTLAILSANCYLNRVRRDKHKNVIISTFIEVGVLGKTNTCVGKNQHLKNVKKETNKKSKG